MNRQSGLGRGLSALLPPTSIYETPKDIEDRENDADPESPEQKTRRSSDDIKVHAPHIFSQEPKSSRVIEQERPKKESIKQELITEEATLDTLFTRLLNDLTSDSPGIGVVYKALYELVQENNLDDAILVVYEPGLGKQVFTHDRRPLVGDDEKYLEYEPGLYTSPQIAISQTQAQTIAQLCAVGLRIDLLKYDAWHDSLTGLYDRRSFDRLLDMAVARSVRYQWPFTLVLIDLDGFKELNDKQGHQAGDAALRSLGDRFRRILRFGDNAARIGGDEFALILPETEPEDVPPLLERIAMVNGNEPAIGFSYGLAICPSEADGLDTLFKLADERLYEAKAKQKNG